jgi:hypothetical protein
MAWLRNGAHRQLGIFTGSRLLRRKVFIEVLESLQEQMIQAWR